MSQPPRLAGAQVLFALAVTFVATPAAAADRTPIPTEPLAIYGGEATPTCGWPSTVFLQSCSGTLIHPEIVMYAGHCGEQIPRVWFGEDLSESASGVGGISVDTEYCMVNPAIDQATSLTEFRSLDFAFCKLAEPVLDVPIVPPLHGCEKTILTPGKPVTLVGFGYDEQDVFGVKREVETTLHYLDDLGVAVIGGEGNSSCNGDSGGPAFVQMPDGSWRVFGIVSGPNVGQCGDPSWYSTSFLALPFIEAESGIDVTPCHYADGTWNPSPACGEFPLEPGDGTGKSWRDGCAGGPISPPSSACGPAFDDREDLDAPDSAIVDPIDRTRIDTAPDEVTASLVVVAEASDAISGVARMELALDGAILPGGLRTSPPWSWNVEMPPGVWSLQAVATDWAGNEGWSAETVIGVNEDPPPAPEPGTSSGEDDGASDGEASDDGTSGTPPIDVVSSSEGGSTGDAAATSTDAGCGCRAGGARSASLWLLLGLGALARRRRGPPHCDGSRGGRPRFLWALS